MNRRSFLQGTVTATAAAALTKPPAASAAEAQPATLPKPQKLGGKPLLQALSERKTRRDVGEEKLTRQQLSDLLWAAFGVNREDGRRTAPTAMNVQDIRIYACLQEGVFLYDAAAHALLPIEAGDQRAKVGGQAQANRAAVVLVFVADYAKYNSLGGGRSFDASRLAAWANVHVGFIAQNVYLYAASEGLAAWFRATMDSEGLSKLLNLETTQKLMYVQSVGVPAKNA